MKWIEKNNLTNEYEAFVERNYRHTKLELADIFFKQKGELR